MTHQITLGQDAHGNISRLDNAIAGIEKRLQGAKDHLESLYHDQENAKAEVGKPFPQEEELKVKSARLIELDTLLNMDERGAEPIAGEEFGDLDDEPGGDTVGDVDDEPDDTNDPEKKPSINDALNQPQPHHDRGTFVKREEEVR